ncbi:MAG: SDR family oxidoreductase [Salegentibacter sp.]
MKKTILITGASSGIGRETARYFAARSWNVAATMRSPEKETELKELPNTGIYKLDVTDKENIAETLKKVEVDFGRIDVLLNNAGYSAVGVFEKSTSEEIRKQFDVNVFGLMDLTREIIPYFRKRGTGTIINLSSIGGRATFPLYSPYHASKWAVEGFAESLQFELRPFNIKVKNIEPGPIKTDFYDRSQNVFENDNITGYEDFEQNMLDYMQKAGKTAPGPEIVAETIYKAATDGKFKLRYPAGKQAKMALGLRSILPSAWFNGIVRRMSNKISKKS